MALYRRGRIWYADFYLDGQRVQTSTGTPIRREAERFLAMRLAGDQPIRPIRISLEEFGRRYMEYAQANKRSWVRDGQLLKQLSGFYKSALLSDIGTMSVESYKLHRMKQVSPATVNREIALLKHMYNLAEAWGLHRGRNPVKAVRFLPENNLKLRTLSEEEEARLLPRCPLYLHDMIVFAIHTGLRSGDIFRLKWEDINTRENQLKIIVRKTNRELELPLSDKVTAILAKWRAIRRCPYVFYNQLTGDRFHDVKTALKKAVAAAGLTDITWHTFRHTFATRLVAGNADLVTIKELMGHAEIKTTMRYAHTSRQAKRRAVNLLSDKVVTDPSEAA
jgi:integrase